MEKRCGRCGSEKIAIGVLAGGHRDPPATQVRVEGKPKALLFSDSVTRKLTAEICGDCGVVQFFAEDPGPLYEAYRRSQDG